MSGRLIILPKKSYCPWKPENVERVLRDERLERERLERLERQEMKEESKQRLASLQQNNNINDTARNEEASLQHVNLFRQEEQQAMTHQTLIPKRGTEPRNCGIMPVRLDSVVRRDEPFYLSSATRPTATGHEDDCGKDIKRKAKMDPMKAFCATTRTTNTDVESKSGACMHRRDEANNEMRNGRQQSSSRKGRKKSSDSTNDLSLDSDKQSSHTRKRRRRRHEKRQNKHAGTDSTNSVLEELRRKRQAREHKESQREAALIRQTSTTLHDKDRRYQNQFHPSLSRR